GVGAAAKDGAQGPPGRDRQSAAAAAALMEVLGGSPSNNEEKVTAIMTAANLLLTKYHAAICTSFTLQATSSM
ncbi:unnamed protein product, partial [Heterosigma akashiwo]